MVGVFAPTIVEKASDIMLGEGAVYKNFEITGTNGEVAIGATKDGSKLEIEREIKNVKYDGAYGPTKGMRRYEKLIPKLTVNFLKLNYENLSYGLPVTVTSGTDKDGEYREINFRLDILANDVLKNVAFKGQKHNGANCLIILENALNIDSLSLEFKGDEVSSEMVYTGFYSYREPTKPPISVRDYISA